MDKYFIESLRINGYLTNKHIYYLIKQNRICRKREEDARRKKVRKKVDKYKKRRVKDHTGIYRDKEFQKGFKYWRKTKYKLANSTNPVDVRSYNELREAIHDIRQGRKNANHYRNVVGINNYRLKLAQSWRDREIPYGIKDIVQLNYRQIIIELKNR